MQRCFTVNFPTRVGFEVNIIHPPTWLLAQSPDWSLCSYTHSAILYLVSKQHKCNFFYKTNPFLCLGALLDPALPTTETFPLTTPPSSTALQPLQPLIQFLTGSRTLLSLGLCTSFLLWNVPLCSGGWPFCLFKSQQNVFK